MHRTQRRRTGSSAPYFESRYCCVVVYSKNFQVSGSRKRLFIIVNLQKDWEDELPSPERVSWYSSAASTCAQFYEIAYNRYSDDRDEYWWELEEPDSSVRHWEPLGNLGSDLIKVRLDIHKFYVRHFIPHGILDMELALARAEVVGIEVPRPVVIRLKP